MFNFKLWFKKVQVLIVFTKLTILYAPWAKGTHCVIHRYALASETLPFSQSIDISEVPCQVQDELLDLRNDSSAKEVFIQKSLTKFSCAMLSAYPSLSILSLKVLVPFATTYLCESGFSALVAMKCDKRNRLNVEDDMRVSLSKTEPKISDLAKAVAPQCLH